MPVPPPYAPEGEVVPRWVPGAPFRFTATATVPVISPGTYEQIGVLEEGTNCRALEVSGAWVLAEDRSGYQGWVPLTAVPVWHPGGPALVGVIVSVFATAAAAFTAWWAAVEYTGCFLTCDPGGENRLGGVILAVVAAMVLVGGLVVARLAGTGGRGRLSRWEAAALFMAPAAAGTLHWAAWANLWVVGWVAVGGLVVGSWFVWRAAARSRARPPSKAAPGRGRAERPASPTAAQRPPVHRLAGSPPPRASQAPPGGGGVRAWSRRCRRPSPRRRRPGR